MDGCWIRMVSKSQPIKSPARVRQLPLTETGFSPSGWIGIEPAIQLPIFLVRRFLRMARLQIRMEFLLYKRHRGKRTRESRAGMADIWSLMWVIRKSGG